MGFNFNHNIAQIPIQEFYMRQFRHVNTELFHYVFLSDFKKIKTICDNRLNNVAGKVNWFVPYSDKIIVSFSNGKCTNPSPCSSHQLDFHVCLNQSCPRLECVSEKNKAIGTFKGNALTFSILIQRNDGKVFAYEIFGFMDDPTSFHHYREVVSQDRNLCTLSPAFGFNALGERDLNQLRMVLNSVKAMEGDQTSHLFLSIEGGQGGVNSAAAGALVNLQPVTFSPKDVRGIINFVNFTTPRITLRQFRGTVTTNKAVYQEILSYTPGFIKITEMKEMHSNGQLSFQDVSAVVNYDCPIRDVLGLEKNLTSLKLFYAKMDYSLLGQEKIWDGVN